MLFIWPPAHLYLCVVAFRVSSLCFVSPSVRGCVPPEFPLPDRSQKDHRGMTLPFLPCAHVMMFHNTSHKTNRRKQQRQNLTCESCVLVPGVVGAVDVWGGAVVCYLDAQRSRLTLPSQIGKSLSTSGTSCIGKPRIDYLRASSVAMRRTCWGKSGVYE